MTELLDDSASLLWRERHLHPDGLHCPRCRSAARRLFRAQDHFPAYRCRACEGCYTLLTGTVFKNTATTGHSGATAAWGRQGRADGAPGARIGGVAQTAPYPAAAPPGQPERHRANRGDVWDGL
jgi:hypothetical protein